MKMNRRDLKWYKGFSKGLLCWITIFIILTFVFATFYEIEKDRNEQLREEIESYPKYYRFAEGTKIITNYDLEEVNCGFKGIDFEEDYYCYKDASSEVEE